MSNAARNDPSDVTQLENITWAQDQDFLVLRFDLSSLPPAAEVVAATRRPTSKLIFAPQVVLRLYFYHASSVFPLAYASLASSVLLPGSHGLEVQATYPNAVDIQLQEPEELTVRWDSRLEGTLEWCERSVKLLDLSLEQMVFYLQLWQFNVPRVRMWRRSRPSSHSSDRDVCPQEQLNSIAAQYLSGPFTPAAGILVRSKPYRPPRPLI